MAPVRQPQERCSSLCSLSIWTVNFSAGCNCALLSTKDQLASSQFNTIALIVRRQLKAILEPRLLLGQKLCCIHRLSLGAARLQGNQTSSRVGPAFYTLQTANSGNYASTRRSAVACCQRGKYAAVASFPPLALVCTHLPPWCCQSSSILMWPVEYLGRHRHHCHCRRRRRHHNETVAWQA